MNRSQIFSILVAVLSISALGIAATTLETTLTTDPDEELNPDWDRLPIGQGDAASILEQMGDGGEDSGIDRESENVGEGGHASGDSNERDEGIGSGTGTDSGAGEWSLLERLLALLVALLQVIVPLALILALGALVYRYREKLFGLGRFDSSEEPIQSADPETDVWPGTTPSNVVDRAWLRMVQLVEPEHPETTTTAECRTRAVERGLDIEAVEAITTAFERVHYGGAPLAEEEERARKGLNRLDSERMTAPQLDGEHG